ncbi:MULTISPECIES: hypothetical protein [Metallosphaera]|uniref:Uncharacterized protein n=1 Tax=Metallosphaera prunae TaxID=47304 RepID=A0A4D8RV48_METPR|nr:MULTISPECIES: hypothetical protein [Metallosphaera]QCO30783.1 hypothetical protein DFR88_10050 [Metallosphaera prunae]BBL47764.1 hypothetical protein MJ1HA_1870 [Metallosphaera sedula]
MKAQSEFIAFIIAIILIVVILVPLAFLVLDFSKPSAQQVDEISVLRRQIDGGSILLFFNSTPSKSTLLTIRGGSNYTLEGVFYDYHGQWINISNKITPSVPAPLIYNFTLPSYVWNRTLLLEISGYNVSVFATVLPNETAFA